MADRLSAMAAAVSRSSQSIESTAVVPGDAAVEAAAVAGQPPRKRGRQVHERQVLADFFSDQDQAEGTKPPTDLIKAMSTADLYEDVYKQSVDVSFDNLPSAAKERMLAEIAAVAPKVASRVVQASDADPTAITVPREHMHDTVLIPYSAIERAATDRLSSVKEAHRAQLCELHSYDVLEDFARSLEFGGADRKVQLRKLLSVDLRASPVHSMHHTDDLSYIILELEDRQVFFAAVGMRWCGDTADTVSLTASRKEEYVPWSTAVLGDLGASIVEVTTHFYFSCPCV